VKSDPYWWEDAGRPAGPEALPAEVDVVIIGAGLLPSAILKPFVREQCSWTVAHHTTFQLYHYGHLIGANPDAREVWREHPYFDDCAEFCARWDQCSFDPDYDDAPIDFFEPMLREVFARAPNRAESLRAGEREPLQNPVLAEERVTA